MGKTQKHDGWSLNQGLAAQYAAQAGLDPDMAADAGEAVWDVLKSLCDAVDERDPVRKRKRVFQTKRRLKKAGLSRHTALVKTIQDRLASLEGRGPSVNPETGLPEYFWPFGAKKGDEEKAAGGQTEVNSLQGQSIMPAPAENDIEWAEKQYRKFFANRDDVGAHPERVAIFSELEQRFNPSGASLSLSPRPDQANDHARIQEIKRNAYLNAKPALPEDQAAWNKKTKLKSGEERYPVRDNFRSTGAYGQLFAGPNDTLYSVERDHLSDDPLFNYYTTLRDALSESQDRYNVYKRDLENSLRRSVGSIP